MLRSCMLKSGAAATITTRARLVEVLPPAAAPWKCPSPLSSSSSSSSSTAVTTSMRRRYLSSSSNSNSSSTTTTTGGNTKQKFANEAERTAYLRQANTTMEQYHNARQLMKRGKLPRHASHPSNNQSDGGFGKAIEDNAGKIQVAVLGIFLAAFIAMPFLSKRIANDAEFRKRYIPAWYDFTVQVVPDYAWTREELHEQRLIIEQALRRRAAAGDFEPNKLQQLQKKMDDDDDDDNGTPVDEAISAAVATTAESLTAAPNEQRRREAMWDKWHPGLADDEKVNEEE